jgi:hypothetical protein
MVRTLWNARYLCGLLAVAALAPSARPQTAAPQTVEDVLHQMSDQADVIFVGKVLGIHPHEDSGMASGYVEVDFRVDQAVRGCTAGTYVMREWAGLWAGDAHRYRPGERLLMMLHAPGPSGMSSPVGGMDGAIPIRGVAGASPLAAAASTPTAPVADLRWLGAKVQRSQSYTLHSFLSPTPLTISQQMAPAGSLTSASALIAAPIAVDDDTSARSSIPAQQASVETVTTLLRSWHKASNDAR